jgi:hypothetical protein
MQRTPEYEHVCVLYGQSCVTVTEETLRLANQAVQT